MIEFEMKHPRATMDHLGFIPFFLSENNPASAKEQIDASYAHGGGWRTHHGWTMKSNGALSFPGDPDLRVIAEAKLRDEIIRVYEMSWVAIVQPNGEYEVARID